MPVLEREVLGYIGASKGGGEFLDCTLGGGGHTEAILRAAEDNKVVAIDRDLRAINRASKRLAKYGQRVELLHSSFSGALELVKGRTFDGILADLGISSDQLLEQRGFSFDDAYSLDMRMDESQVASAHSVVNESSEHELFKILKEGGVGSEARSICRAIIKARPIQSALALKEVVVNAAPHYLKKKRVNPATITFQAIRISVNDELNEVKALLGSVPNLIKRPGRVVVISFHSLEDKIVTRTMRLWEQGGHEGFSALWPGANLPRTSFGKLLTRKAVVASEAEVSVNKRARSALLRVFEFCN